jgi:AAHS family 4-hydroxybenzoate transporter-like MFS transporter
MPCTTTLLAEYVPTRSRSLLITCMFTGFNVGSALIGFLAAAIVPAFGWRAVLILGGCLPLAMLPLYWFWLPESARFMVVRNKPSGQVARTLNWVCRADVPHDAVFASQELAAHPRQRVLALLKPTFRLTTLALWTAYFMGLVVIYLFSSWMPTLITRAGLSIEYAANVTAMFQVGGTVGAILVGFLMDRRAPQRVIAAAYVGGVVAALLLSVIPAGSTLFVVVVILAGFCISGGHTGLNAHAPACYPTAIRATGVSWMLGIGRFGSIFGSMIGGVMLTAGWAAAGILGSLAVPGMLAALSSLGSHRVDVAPDGES